MSMEADDGGQTSPITPRSISEISTSTASTTHTHPALTVLIGGRFRLSRRLGSGAFGEVFVGIELASGEQVAIKLEPLISQHQPHLQHEARLYSFLQRGLTTCGIPRVRWFGREGDFNVMVMDLLGPSLEDLFDFCGRQFSTKTVLMLMEQMISRVEFLHAMCYLHRDLKPDNFVMGTQRRAHHVYLIDLGLCKRYCDLRTREHIPFIDGKSLTGTARYVSINTHLGRQQSRRDDLESLALIAIYFARGALPWQGIRGTTKLDKYEKIKQMKLRTPIADLCKHHAPCFAAFLAYARQLEFTEKPDYDKCRAFFSEQMAQMSLPHDFGFSWLVLRDRSENQLTESASEVLPPGGSGGGGGNGASPARGGVVVAAAGPGMRRSRASMRNSSVVSQSGGLDTTTNLGRSPIMMQSRSQDFGASATGI